MKNVFLLGTLLLTPGVISAQSAMASSTQSPAPATVLSPSKVIGVFVFGRNGQSSDKQLKDESECYAAAKQHSGIDPDAPARVAMAAEPKQSGQKAAGKSNDPVGGTHSVSSQHLDSSATKKEAAAKLASEQKLQEERTKFAHVEGLDPFQRAFSACMEARNYSVK